MVIFFNHKENLIEDCSDVQQNRIDFNDYFVFKYPNSLMYNTRWEKKIGGGETYLLSTFSP